MGATLLTKSIMCVLQVKVDFTFLVIKLDLSDGMVIFFNMLTKPFSHPATSCQGSQPIPTRKAARSNKIEPLREVRSTKEGEKLPLAPLHGGLGGRYGK